VPQPAAACQSWHNDGRTVPILVSIFASDILPIFAIAAIGFLLARHLETSARTLSRVVFNALSPCLVFNLLVTSRMTASEFGRMALFCVLLTLARGAIARIAAVPLGLQRSPKLTRGCSPEEDHADFPPLTRASADAHEAALLHLSPMVCTRPPRGSSPARVFGTGLPDRSPGARASLVASS
jgi:hypothetical protein